MDPVTHIKATLHLTAHVAAAGKLAADTAGFWVDQGGGRFQPQELPAGFQEGLNPEVD